MGCGASSTNIAPSSTNIAPASSAPINSTKESENRTDSPKSLAIKVMTEGNQQENKELPAAGQYVNQSPQDLEQPNLSKIARLKTAEVRQAKHMLGR